MSRRFAVIDTETNWKDEVMSIGVLIARSKDFEIGRASCRERV